MFDFIHLKLVRKIKQRQFVYLEKILDQTIDLNAQLVKENIELKEENNNLKRELNKI